MRAGHGLCIPQGRVKGPLDSMRGTEHNWDGLWCTPQQRGPFLCSAHTSGQIPPHQRCTPPPQTPTLTHPHTHTHTHNTQHTAHTHTHTHTTHTQPIHTILGRWSSNRHARCQLAPFENKWTLSNSPHTHAHRRTHAKRTTRAPQRSCPCGVPLWGCTPPTQLRDVTGGGGGLHRACDMPPPPPTHVGTCKN